MRSDPTDYELEDSWDAELADEGEESELDSGSERSWVGMITMAVAIGLLLTLPIGPIILAAQILQGLSTGVWTPFDIAQFLAWMSVDEPRLEVRGFAEAWSIIRKAETGAALFVLSMLFLIGLSRILRGSR